MTNELQKLEETIMNYVMKKNEAGPYTEKQLAHDLNLLVARMTFGEDAPEEELTTCVNCMEGEE